MVVLYSVAECQQTRAIRKFFVKKGVEFIEKQDEQMAADAPFVQTGDFSWSGFRPELIDLLCKGTVIH